jgi:hypothetical protein
MNAIFPPLTFSAGINSHYNTIYYGKEVTDLPQKAVLG